MRRTWIVAAALLLLPAATEAAGVIRGTVWSTRAESKHAIEVRERAAAARVRAPSRFAYLGTPSLQRPKPMAALPPVPTVADSTPSPGILRVVLSVARIPTEVEKRFATPVANTAPADTSAWCVGGAGCDPAVLVVAAGALVRFENRDTLWHRVFGTARNDSIDVGALGPGATRSLRLSRPGTYAILCGLHTTELGYLMVAPNHAFAQPDSLGRFALPALPPGRYELAMWDPERGSRRVALEIPPGRDVYCDLAF